MNKLILIAAILAVAISVTYATPELEDEDEALVQTALMQGKGKKANIQWRRFRFRFRRIIRRVRRVIKKVKKIGKKICGHKLTKYAKRACGHQDEMLAHIESDEERAEAQFFCKVVGGVSVGCRFLKG